MLYEVLTAQSENRMPQFQEYGSVGCYFHLTYEETEATERPTELPRSPGQVPEELPNLTLSSIFGP